MNQINWSPTEEMIRGFSLKLLLSFPIAGLFWTFVIYFLGNENFLDWRIFGWIGGIGISVAIASLLSFAVGHLVWILWFSAVVIIDKLIVWATLPVFFLLLFSPYATVVRLFRKKSLIKTLANKESKTYWLDEKPIKSEDQYFRQF